ncbi:MAG TPA: hypothetical protein VN761_10940 [Candidatus Polarisedimenticolia bacterium]|nr:hypothetical protein [Candidatus Polarisedimenticolia bacterium]
MKKFPARLHVLLARDAKTAVVFRRGPSKSTCSVLWNRKTDEFKTGQWLRGRIYERRSDISPDGKFLIYFAMNGKWESETKGAWTAISKAPWLKALALFGKGDCWHGGGLFTSEKNYWLNDGYGHQTIRNSSSVRRDEKFRPKEYYGGECLGVYFVRLQRDGWELKTDLSETTTFEKPLSHGWRLRKHAHADLGHPPGKGCYWDEHELQADDGQRIDGSKWEWADVDGKKLVWAEAGCLFRSTIKKSGMGERKLLYDFNEMKFKAIPAPY